MAHVTPDLMRDSRVRSVQWSDLLTLSKWEIIKELLLSAPWLVSSLILAQYGHYLFALPLSFIFFLTGLRQVHNAYHYALGLSKRSTEWMMFALSVLMLGSMHAIQLTHLHHHKHCMDEDDIEAQSARMSGLRALLMGPLFPLRLHRKALTLAAGQRRRWIWCELGANLLFIGAAFFVLDMPWLKYHILVMAAGQCLTSFFAVWTVHHDCHPKSHIARTIRHPLKSLIVFDMFFHLEHHLFPRVPTCHLQQLAQRLDDAAPEIQQLQVY